MFSDFFRRLASAADDKPLNHDDARLALAALLVRLARADGDYAAIEVSAIDTILRERFALSPFEAAELRTNAEAAEAAKNARPDLADAIEDGRGGFCDDMAEKFRTGNLPTGRAMVIAIEILAKKAGRKNSKAFNARKAELEGELS